MSSVTIQRLLPVGDRREAMCQEVVAGLTATPRQLHPTWLYDARGSELFEEITRLPEYYLTRAEREILADRAGEIAALTGAGTLVDLGSGSSEKTRLLLATLRTALYVPVEVSETALAEAVRGLRVAFPDLSVHGLLADFGAPLDGLPRAGRCLVAFLGSTIGNLPPADRARFLAGVRAVLRPGDALLLGADLVKDPAVLVAAYDDTAGVTAEFNRNVLRVLNRELNGDFDVAGFAHVARWNPTAEWMEMRLRAVRPHRVRLRAAGLVLDLGAGEEIRTEISAKFRPEGLAAELAAADLPVSRWWTDRAGRFGVALSIVD